MERTRLQFNGDIAYLTSNTAVAPRSAEEQRGIYGQNVVIVILSVSGLGSARVNHNAELCIIGLNQKISPYHTT